MTGCNGAGCGSLLHDSAWLRSTMPSVDGTARRLLPVVPEEVSSDPLAGTLVAFAAANLNVKESSGSRGCIRTRLTTGRIARRPGTIVSELPADTDRGDEPQPRLVITRIDEAPTAIGHVLPFAVPRIEVELPQILAIVHVDHVYECG